MNSTRRCCICDGPAHPATGAQYSERAVCCGPCVREFWTWIRASRNGGRARGGGADFYSHVNYVDTRVFYRDGRIKKR